MTWAWYGLSFVVVVLDQWTKQWAVNYFALGQFQTVTPFFDLTLAFNRGAAFSFLSDAGGWQRWFFSIVSAGVSVVLVVWLWRLGRSQKLLALGLALVLGGASGRRDAIVRLVVALPVAGLIIAAAFYPLARLAGYVGALLVTWIAMWLTLALLQRWAHNVESLGTALMRGAIGAVASGLSFWAISGIWTSPDPPDWAWALRTMPEDMVASAAAPPAASPDRLRNVRRSIALPTTPANALDKRGPFATPFVFFVSIDLS